jgi:hypothetical protein
MCSPTSFRVRSSLAIGRDGPGSHVLGVDIRRGTRRAFLLVREPNEFAKDFTP